jgi:class 3 adenylate cyclase
MERRLAAILAADVVGYSRLVERDESGALAAFNDRRKTVLEPLLAIHRGRIVKLMGGRRAGGIRQCRQRGAGRRSATARHGCG